jgi:flagellar export protein FliJ
MGADRADFKYGLHALLRKRNAELDTVKGELALANLHVEARERDLESRSAHVRQLESHQRDSSRDGAAIDIDARMRLHLCLRNAVIQQQEQAAQLEQARARQEKVIEKLREAREALKAIERHREQSVERFHLEQLRKEQLATDDLYLAGTPARRSTPSARER